jgi:outer membrane protein assembly factor BamB
LEEVPMSIIRPPASLARILGPLTAGVVAALGSPANAADWPIFRGNPLQTGVAADSLPDELEIRWKFKTKESVEGTGAIVGATVYVGSLDGHLYALDLATGKERWKYKAGPFKAPPSVRDGVVYVGDLDGMFHAIEVDTGKKRWTFETSGDITGGANFAGKNVIFGSGDETLYCLSADGKQVWTFKVPGGPVMATPALVGNRTFVSGCDSTLHVLDAETGKELGSVDLGSPTGATPAVLGDRLYVGTMQSNQLLAVDWKKPEVAWRFEAARRAAPFFASAAVSDRLVVSASRDKRVHALDRATGQEVWSFPTGGKLESSPVISGQRVYIGSLDQHLYVLDLATGKELGKHNLGGEIYASPAVGGNALVLGTTTGLVYCFAGKK